MATLKSYVSIGVPGPRGPKGDGYDLGVTSNEELRALIIDLINDYIDGGVPPAPSPGSTYFVQGYAVEGYVV
jgi:hypothetical protein